MKLIRLLLTTVLITTISFAQASTSDTVLTVSGEVTTPLKLTMADLMKLPHRVVRAVDHDKHEYAFEGVDVFQVLSLAGVTFCRYSQR